MRSKEKHIKAKEAYTLGLNSAKKTKTFNAPLSEVWGALLKSVSNLRFRIEYVDEAKGVIIFSSGLSLLSSGTRFGFKLNESGKNLTEAIGKAKAKGIALIDYGRSDRELDKVFSSMESLLKQPATGARGQNKNEL
ncbi:MAG: hypothetical protein PWR28_1503 [Synergistaceae bacterium]|nr:hypothetical protein [Synergistaceae bacterium]